MRKNNGLVRNRQAHLACYSLRGPTFHPRWVVILNQFGHPRLVVFRPDSLCVPSLKRSLLPDPCDPGHLALFVGGTNGDDVIQVQSGTNNTVRLNGVLSGSFAGA